MSAPDASSPTTPPLENRPHQALLTAARLVSFSLICALLFWGKVVAIPLALAVLFSFMLNPLVKRMQTAKVPRPAAVGIAVTFSCALLLGLTWLIGSQLFSLTQELPNKKQNITAKIKQVREFFRGGAVESFHQTMDTVKDELKNDGDPAEKKASTEKEQEPIPVYLKSPANPLDLESVTNVVPFLDPLMTAGLVLLLVILLMLRWDDMRSRLLSFTGHRNLTVATKACDDAGKRITRYLMMQLLVNGSYGITVGIGLYLMKVEYAALWALCAGLFRYVPYAGPAVGALLPITFSFMWSDTWAQPLWVAGFIVCLEIISNNVIEPWLYGSSLGLSAMGIIMSAVAWTLLWGPVGLVMATPLTVVLVVMGEYVPAFAIFTRLLGDKPVMEPHFQFYQRLLAHDETEANELARSYVKEHDLREFVDNVFVPALGLAKRDETADLLEKDDGVFITTTAEAIFQKLRETVETAEAKETEKAEKTEETEETPAPAPVHRAPVIVWPLNEFGVTAARLMQWMMRDTTADIILLTPQTLLGEAAAEVRNRQAVAICLLNLAGSDTARTRSFVKRLRADFPNLPVTVARLGVSGTLDPEMRDTFKNAGAASVTRTLSETSAALVPYANDAAQPLPAGSGASPAAARR